MLVKFEQNRMVQTTRNFEFFDKKLGFFITTFDKMLTPSEDVTVAKIVG